MSRKHILRRSAWIGSGLVALATSGGMVAAPGAAAQAPTPVPLLSQGSAGTGVARVQRALHLHPNGRFNAATRRAVLRFQRHDHLIVDGIVGPQTWGALFHVRTQPAPSAATAPSTQTGSTAPASTSTGGYSIPSSIVMCESGGNYSAVNPSSGAGGAYQILPSTWRAYGGQGLPQDAPKAQQDRIASQIYASQGSSAWVC